MRIAIDCRYIGKSGIGTYIENIVKCLLDNYPMYDYLLISDDRTFKSNAQNVTVQYTDIKPFSVQEIFRFPVSEINKCDVFFTPYINIPLGIKIPIFSTIHDVIFLDLPGIVSTTGKIVRKLFLWNAVRVSKTVFTVSHFSEGRIKYHFGDKKPIVVTYSAISDDIKKYEKKIGEKEDYYIYIGNIKKHKGLHVLVEAFNKAKAKGLSSKLYIVGDNTKFRSNDEDFNKVLATSKDVAFTGFLPNDKLIEMLSKAKALVLPSFYEGLGLPPMEALYLGTNAIISDIEVFKEIYKDLPVTYFKTGDAENLADVLLSYQCETFDVNKVRTQIDSTYNFEKITEKILQTITNKL